MRIIWTRGAVDDGNALVLALHETGPRAARRLMEEFALAGERLSDFPRMGMRADEEEGRFSILVGRGRFRVSYRIDDDAVRILGRAGQRRDGQANLDDGKDTPRARSGHCSNGSVP